MRTDVLAGLIVVVWVLSWWGPRAIRLWFAVLSPFGVVAAFVVAFLRVPPGSCEHGCVQGALPLLDDSVGLANAERAFPVAVGVAAVTVIVELVLLVRRRPPAPPQS